MLSGQGLRGPILLPEHYEDLGFDRLDQRRPAENLSGHYAWQRNHVASARELVTAEPLTRH